MSCLRCGLEAAPGALHELWRLDFEIGRLTRYRADLLASLHAPRVVVEDVPLVWAAPVGGDVSRFGVRNVLLALGGALLGVAALAFTAISWGSLGMGARAVILMTLTAVALGSAWPLARRGLNATAETLAVVGLLLMTLQAYAAHAGNLLGVGVVDGRFYAAGAAAVIAVGWILYARFAPLRLPAPLAVVVGHAPPLLLLVAFDVPETAALATLLLLSLADLGLREVTSGPERGTATVLGLLGVGSGALLAFANGSPVMLGFAAAVFVAWALRLDRKLAAGAGLSCAVALAFCLPDGWSLAAPALAAAAVVVASRALPVRLRGPAAVGALPVFGFAVLWTLPGTVEMLAAPFTSGHEAGAAPVVLGLLALGLGVVCRSAAPPVAVLAGLAVAPTWSMGLFLTAALCVWAALDRGRTRLVAAATVPVVAVWTLFACPGLQVNAVVLGLYVLLGLAAAYAVAELRGVAVAFAVLSLGGFAMVLGLLWLPTHQAAFGLLVAAALGLALSLRVRSVPGEVASWLVAMAALGLVFPHLALGFALTGVLAFAVAAHPERRAAGWAGAGLFVAAWWTFLATLGVVAPEAYTAPVSAALLVVGLVHRTRRPAPNSWAAYGPALATTLLPSLVAAWPDHGPRPLSLALAALAVTLVGVRSRLQAPLLLGGATLLLVAGHAVAPLLTEFFTRLPGWVPVAALGLFTLVLGATYEQRLRDLRRLQSTFTSLR